MTERDPLESLEQALFRAARRERTRTRALERTATALVATHRRRRVQRSLFALAATVALAAALALVLRNGPSAESIEAERIVPKHAVSSVVGAPSISAPRAVASDDAETLRSGLAPSVASTTLEEEIVMLNGARAELAAGKAEVALALLDQYDRVSGGHLTAEATLLRIEALSSSGRSALAAKLAQRLVDSDPTGPAAEQARGYIANSARSAQQKP